MSIIMQIIFTKIVYITPRLLKTNRNITGVYGFGKKEAKAGSLKLVIRRRMKPITTRKKKRGKKKDVQEGMIIVKDDITKMYN